MNKETLKEVCDKVLNYLYPNCKKEMSNLQYTNSINSLKSIAKWQQEQDENKKLYSEEEVIDLLYKRDIHLVSTYKTTNYIHPEEWFEQFKKK